LTGLYTETGTFRDIKVRIVYISIYRVNSTALYIEQFVWGTKVGVEQSNGGEKPRHCAGYVTNMGTWRDTVV